jgi:hypothetical protein
LLLVLCAGPLAAQTTVNPDISIIPRFLITTDDGGKLASGIREFGRPDFAFQELEIAIQSYLNPYAKGDVILTLPGPDVEGGKLGVEEVYASVLRGLPADLNIRIGKYRAEFGKLNLTHPHAWPFITQPLVAERFIGEEGLNDLGISFSALLPTGEIYTRLTVDVLRGRAVGGVTGIADSTSAEPYYSNTARLSSFFALTDESDLELGLSGYTGIHDPYSRERFWYTNLDVKYKYRPSSYTSLTLQGEYLLNRRTAVQDRDLKPLVGQSGAPVSLTTSGWYLYADCQFNKIFSAGGRVDVAQAPYRKEDKASAFSLFFGYYPVEETLGLRLEYQNKRSEIPGLSQSVNTIALQVLFSMGPHKAHPF